MPSMRRLPDAPTTWPGRVPMGQQPATAWPGEASAWRQTPSREPSVSGDVWVPMFQSLTTGALFGAPLGGLVAYLLDGPVWWAGVGVLAVTAPVWALLLRSHRQLLWALESATRRDLNGDGYTGEPGPPEELRVTIDYLDPDGRLQREQILNVRGVTGEQLRDFARAVAVDGRGLAVAYWAGGGKPFSQTTYAGLMAELTSAGLVEDAGGNTGRILTRAGRAVLKKLAERS